VSATRAMEWIGYCQRLPQDSDEALECWEAYNYVDFESGRLGRCAWEGAKECAGVANRECMLDNLEDDMKKPQCSNFLEWENFLRRTKCLTFRRVLIGGIVGGTGRSKVHGGDNSHSQESGRESAVGQGDGGRDR